MSSRHDAARCEEAQLERLRYSEVRDLIIAEDGWTCQACGQPITPEMVQNRIDGIHHIWPTGDGGDHCSSDNMITLCGGCHKKVHRSELRFGADDAGFVTSVSPTLVYNIAILRELGYREPQATPSLRKTYLQRRRTPRQPIQRRLRGLVAALQEGRIDPIRPPITYRFGDLDLTIRKAEGEEPKR